MNTGDMPVLEIQSGSPSVHSRILDVMGNLVESSLGLHLTVRVTSTPCYLLLTTWPK